MISVPKLAAFAGAIVACAALLAIVRFTDLGKAIRAVAKEKHGERLMGIAEKLPKQNGEAELPRKVVALESRRIRKRR